MVIFRLLSVAIALLLASDSASGLCVADLGTALPAGVGLC